jgi:HSP20 family molecular chaperone IbpA
MNFTPFLDKMINKAMKMIEKQMKDLPNGLDQNTNQPRNPNMHVQFFVNGKKVFPQKTQQPNKPNPLQIQNKLSKQKAEKFAKLPRKEPKTTMKRLAGRLVYELAMPGVEDINDILINQLENSIEIKALSKNKVYSKTLNVNLPIIGYDLDEGNLVLELQTR